MKTGISPLKILQNVLLAVLIMLIESKVSYQWLLDSWSPDLAWFGKQLRKKKPIGYVLERPPDATVFTAFLPTPKKSLTTTRFAQPLFGS